VHSLKGGECGGTQARSKLLLEVVFGVRGAGHAPNGQIESRVSRYSSMRYEEQGCTGV
jgi:hypothetical protein